MHAFKAATTAVIVSQVSEVIHNNMQFTIASGLSFGKSHFIIS
ncbi:hypothetical protein [Methanobrevibacter sp.]|nr:hypothetical protein [Methanobrevibacter sp.]